MNRITAPVATMLAMVPFWIESLPSSDGPLLDDVQFDRQFAAGERDRQLVGAFDREVAADLRLAAKDRFVDVRC
jgi:hypothetical protein